jgi:hypothetical protein
MKERLGGWSSLELKRLCYAGRFSLPEEVPVGVPVAFSLKVVP